MVQIEHLLHEDGGSQCRTYCLLLRRAMTWPTWSLEITWMSQTFRSTDIRQSRSRQHSVLVIEKQSWARKSDQPWFHRHSQRKFERTSSIRSNMAGTPCATFVFKRIFCVPPPASPMDRVADTVAVDAGESATEVASDFCSICDSVHVFDPANTVRSTLLPSHKLGAIWLFISRSIVWVAPSVQMPNSPKSMPALRVVVGPLGI